MNITFAMNEISNILYYISIGISLISILLALIYSIPIFFIDRFQKFHNIFTVNLCITTICCNIYWLVRYFLIQIYPTYFLSKIICSILIYFEMMCVFQVPLAFVLVSINRLCSIIYHNKVFFKRKIWIRIGTTIQWIIGILFSIPRIPFNEMRCIDQLWNQIYGLMMIVIIPSLIYLIINMFLFKHIRSSARRVQPLHGQQAQAISRRERYLIRHMIIMFCIFVGGWSPVYIYSIIYGKGMPNLLLTSILILLAELSLLFDVLNLFICNHPLRKYLRRKFFQWIRL